jgi:hypothetical protein
MEFSGRLTSVSLADLLQWTSNDRKTGSLVFRTGSRHKEVHFERGQIVGASTDDPREFFGQFLLLEGYLAEDQLMEALTWCQDNRRRLGAGLVELGILGEEEAQHALRRQIEDTVCDLFLWDHGVFYFAEELLPHAEILLPQPIHTVGLAMEGARWQDEHERIRRIFVHDAVALKQGRLWPGEPGDPRQNRILSSLETRLTLEEMYEHVKGSRFRFLETAFDLTVREVLDIDSVGEAASGTSTELRILDLLMDQAAEEEVLFSRRHLSIPLDVLDRFYPVWMETEETPEDLPPDARALCRRMDGDTSLRELVLEDGGDRERRMETILLELRKGNLALLPRPVSEIESTGKKSWLGWLRSMVGGE